MLRHQRLRNNGFIANASFMSPAVDAWHFCDAAHSLQTTFLYSLLDCHCLLLIHFKGVTVGRERMYKKWHESINAAVFWLKIVFIIVTIYACSGIKKRMIWKYSFLINDWYWKKQLLAMLWKWAFQRAIVRLRQRVSYIFRNFISSTLLSGWQKVLAVARRIRLRLKWLAMNSDCQHADNEL